MIRWRDVHAVLDADIERPAQDADVFPGAYTNAVKRFRAAGFKPDDFDNGKLAPRRAMLKALIATEDYLELCEAGHLERPVMAPPEFWPKKVPWHPFVLRPGEVRRAFRPALAARYRAEREAIGNVRRTLEQELYP